METCRDGGTQSHWASSSPYKSAPTHDRRYLKTGDSKYGRPMSWEHPVCPSNSSGEAPAWFGGPQLIPDLGYPPCFTWNLLPTFSSPSRRVSGAIRSPHGSLPGGQARPRPPGPQGCGPCLWPRVGTAASWLQCSTGLDSLPQGPQRRQDTHTITSAFIDTLRRSLWALVSRRPWGSLGLAAPRAVVCAGVPVREARNTSAAPGPSRAPAPGATVSDIGPQAC